MTQAIQPANTNTRLALSLLAVVVGMVMLSFAAVPLYDAFCKITGLGGTTAVADAAPGISTARIMNVRFNTDVDAALDWRFEAPQKPVPLHVGEERVVNFYAKNVGSEGVSGVAVYNVTPHSAAEYFAKIQCFCFENQYLAPGEEMQMPVSFFIDPTIEEDPYLKDLKTVTLSYTFFKSKNQQGAGGAQP